MEVQKSALAEKMKDLENIQGVGGKVKRLTWERLMGNREVVVRWQEVSAIIPYSLLQAACTDFTNTKRHWHSSPNPQISPPLSITSLH